MLQKITMPQPVTPDNVIQSRVRMYDPSGTAVGIGGATLSWSSTDPSVANSTDEDSPNAVIAIYKPGVAIVKCRNDQYQIERAIEFTITAPIAPPEPTIWGVMVLDSPTVNTIGATILLQAQFKLSDTDAGTEPGAPMTWEMTTPGAFSLVIDSANDQIATVTSLIYGSTTVKAISPGGVVASAQLFCVAAPVASPPTTAAILVDPTDPIRMLAGDGVLMGMHFADGQGNEAPAPGDVTWASSDETVVTLTPSGPPGLDGVTATAVKEGTAVITGSVADPALSATIDMDVLTRAATAPPPSTITGMSFTISGWPDTPVGETNSVTAAFKNGSNPAPWVSEPQWISSKPAVFAITGASHTETGSTVNLSAVGPGATSIICIVDGIQGAPADLTVRAADDPEPETDPTAPAPKPAPKKR